MNKLLFLDTETTGKEGRLIQLAYKVPGETFDSFESLYKPPVPIEIEAMSVHHIIEEDVREKSPFEGLEKDILQRFLNDRILVCHNVAFDSGVLVREGLTVGQKICTMKVAHTLLDFPQYKLQYLRYALGLKVEGTAHDAGGDVAVLIELYRFMREKMIYDGISTDEDAAIARMIEITANPVLLKVLPFGKYRGQKFSDVKDMGYFNWMLGTDIGEDLRYTLNHYVK